MELELTRAVPSETIQLTLGMLHPRADRIRRLTRRVSPHHVRHLSSIRMFANQLPARARESRVGVRAPTPVVAGGRGDRAHRAVDRRGGWRYQAQRQGSKAHSGPQERDVRSGPSDEPGEPFSTPPLQLSGAGRTFEADWRRGCCESSITCANCRRSPSSIGCAAVS